MTGVQTCALPISGKTDFLFRRCKGRIFYTLPFQASINAMYKRVANDLKETNPNLDIRVLHSASRIVVKNKTIEEKTLQGLIGSTIKILTPHQIASIIFGTRAFEATILDIKGNDVILDEIHTYTEVSRAIVIKIVEVLNRLGCRLHIGTATMPSNLYDKILNILGKENVYEVSLPKTELDKFDRHIVHKLTSWEDADNIVEQKLYEGLKPVIGPDVTLDKFLSDYRESSHKVGPTIADDIKVAALWAIIFSLIAIFQREKYGEPF